LKRSPETDMSGTGREGTDKTKQGHRSKIQFPVALPLEQPMISFQSDEAILENLRERLRRMTDQKLIKFGKEVRRLAENPFQKQLEEARKEWKPSVPTSLRQV
jgi:uncharacterized protein HemY